MRSSVLPALLLAASPVTAQSVRLDLSGAPAATIGTSFTKISGVQELGGGLAVGTDNMDRAVYLLDFGRRTATKIGAQGRGPNEYQYPSAPQRASSGGAWIFDGSQRRALNVGANGKFAATSLLPESSDLSRARGSDAQGRVYFESSDFDPNTGRFSDSLNVVRWDPKTNAVERVARVYSGGRVIIQRGGGPASLAREITPFPHLNAWAPLPDGRVAIVHREPFRIDIVGPGGKVVAGTPMTSTPIPITADERRIFRERNTPGRVGAALVGGGTGPTSQASQWEDANFPATMPAFIGAAVHSTPDGQVWVGRSFSGKDKTRRYDIFDGSGKLVGSATLRANASVVGFGPKSVYVARVDPDDDLVYLDRYTR